MEIRMKFGAKITRCSGLRRRAGLSWLVIMRVIALIR
jgi:hypothetical protein